MSFNRILSDVLQAADEKMLFAVEKYSQDFEMIETAEEETLLLSMVTDLVRSMDEMTVTIESYGNRLRQLQNKN